MSVQVSATRVRTRPPLVVAAGGLVLTSSLLAVLPEFRFESQLPAFLPVFAWAAAAGIGPLLTSARAFLPQLRAVGGLIFLAPYAVLLLLAAALPELSLPWWIAPAAAGSAAVPFAVLALRRTRPGIHEPRDPDAASRRGTFLISVALMVLTYAATGPAIIAPVFGGLAAAALAASALHPHGVADASRTWRTAHWWALVWGSLVVWAGVLARGLTGIFADIWMVALAMLVAGAPLIALNSWEKRRARLASAL